MKIRMKLKSFMEGVLIAVCLFIVVFTLLQKGDPLLPFLLTVWIAPLFMWTTGTTWKNGIRILFLSCVPLALAMYVLSYFYILFYELTGIYLIYWFFLTMWILAPICEELVKGSMYFLERGGWRVGVLIGVGFGIIESVIYQLHYGVGISVLRWMAISLHASSTALFFQGVHTRMRFLCVLAVGLHISYNFFIPLLMYELGG